MTLSVRTSVAGLRDTAPLLHDLRNAFRLAGTADETLHLALGDGRLWSKGRGELEGAAAKLELVLSPHAKASVRELSLARKGIDALTPALAAIRHLDTESPSARAADEAVTTVETGTLATRKLIEQHFADLGKSSLLFAGG